MPILKLNAAPTPALPPLAPTATTRATAPDSFMDLTLTFVRLEAFSRPFSQPRKVQLLIMALVSLSKTLMAMAAPTAALPPLAATDTRPPKAAAEERALTVVEPLPVKRISWLSFKMAWVERCNQLKFNAAATAAELADTPTEITSEKMPLSGLNKAALGS